MPINEEIIKSHSEDLAYKMRGAITDDERNPYTFEDVITEIDTMLNEARADTAKQIFKAIEDFKEDLVKNIDDNLVVYILGDLWQRVEPLKKKYQVD